MGANACIYFSSKKEAPNFEWGLLEENVIKKVDKFAPEGATHEVVIFGNNRFYGVYYERGVWPRYAAILMELFASPDVTKVWYFSDYDELPGPIEKEDVISLTKHYMDFGCRPYRGK
jgi:hypothetical protein